MVEGLPTVGDAGPLQGGFDEAPGRCGLQCDHSQDVAERFWVLAHCDDGRVGAHAAAVQRGLHVSRVDGAETWLRGGNGAFATKAGEFLAAGTPVAAICGATVGLAAEGLLDERRHPSNAAEALAGTGYQGGELYTDEPAVTDGDLVTAGATAPVEFAREVLARLDVYEPGVLAAWYKLFGLHDPAGYFELVVADG